MKRNLPWSNRKRLSTWDPPVGPSMGGSLGLCPALQSGQNSSFRQPGAAWRGGGWCEKAAANIQLLTSQASFGEWPTHFGQLGPWGSPGRPSAGQTGRGELPRPANQMSEDLLSPKWKNLPCSSGSRWRISRAVEAKFMMIKGTDEPRSLGLI